MRLRSSAAAILTATTLTLAWPGWAAVDLAAEPGPTPTQVNPGSRLPAFGSTSLVGNVRDMRGTWILLSHVEAKPDRILNTLTFYRVTGEPATPVVTRLNLKLTGALANSLRDVNKAGKPWVPDAEQQKALAKDLRMHGKAEDAKGIGIRFTTPDGYLESEAASPQAAGSLFAMQISEKRKDAVVSAVGYYVRINEPKHLSGRFASGAVVNTSAGVPVPLGFAGTFDMIEIGE